MKLKRLVTVCAASTFMMTMAAEVVMAAESFNPTQTKSIQTIVHDYLVKNPEVLVEASQNLQKKQQEAMTEQAKVAIVDHAAQLFSGNMTSVGNLKGNVTLVEFFDYQCIHCKKMSPVVSELIKKDANLRVIYKEFPIFGKSSEMASKAALAAAAQGKYQAMHDALLGQDKSLTDEIVNTVAKSIGLNMTKFDADVKSKSVSDQLDANRELAEQLKLMGTPAFIVASTPAGQFKSGSQPTFIPGAISLTSLQDLIKKAGAN
ncbi:MAG: hypothetical protein A3F46_03405 [Legionellales bacterium RIFCSPHIGHO2_12_FULL_42_9]|nr:MAG: hypothetical protein A3F46_03405 [Legionellales bacterium RIFCSPHIGHO2_12_FULL_42_9]